MGFSSSIDYMIAQAELDVAAERSLYLDEAERSESSDWASWDDSSNSVALFKLWEALNSSNHAKEKVAFCRSIIYRLMESAADGHAEAVRNAKR